MGFQKLHTGRGCVLTKYEPVASRVDFVDKHVCRYGGALFARIMQNTYFVHASIVGWSIKRIISRKTLTKNDLEILRDNMI